MTATQQIWIPVATGMTRATTTVVPNSLLTRRLCGECLCRRLPLGDAFPQYLVEQGFVDELRGVDRLVDFLRGAGESSPVSPSPESEN
jgi:hypothetical protein